MQILVKSTSKTMSLLFKLIQKRKLDNKTINNKMKAFCIF